jgi:hypothetical protein
MELSRFAEEHLAARVADHEVATAFVAPDEVGVAAPAAEFVDGQGRVHTPLLLSTERDGRTHYVGLALLVCNQRRRASVDNDLAIALAGHLLRVGDAAGIAVLG